MKNLKEKFLWDDVRFFLAVVRTGSAHAAAKVLMVDHSTVGRRVRAFEQALGTPVFEPGARRLILTSFGELVFEDFCQMELIAQEAARKAAEFTAAAGKVSGRVNVRVTEGLGVYWLAPRLSQLKGKHPELSIVLSYENERVGDPDQEIDIALTWAVPTRHSVFYRRLAKINFSLVATETYFARYGTINELSELSNHRIAYQDAYDLYPGFKDWREKYLLSGAHIKFESSIVGHSLTVGGEYAGLFPRYGTIIEPKVTAMPVETGLSLDLFMVLHGERRRIPRVRIVSDELAGLVSRSIGEWFEPL